MCDVTTNLVSRDVLEQIAQSLAPDAQVWRGPPQFPESEQGMMVLGSPLGHPSFIQQFLQKKALEHRTLLDRVPQLPSAWSLLLHCASAKANCLLRVVEPNAVAEFAHLHDQRIWNCLCQVFHADPSQNEEVILSLHLFRWDWVDWVSAMRSGPVCRHIGPAGQTPSIRARHGAVADLFVRELEGEPESPFLAAAAEAMRSLTGTMASFVHRRPPRNSRTRRL